MDMQKLGQIMMKWSLESKEWETTLALYTIYGVGIPARYIYKLPKKKVYLSVADSIQGHNNIELFSDDPHLRELLSLFPCSKWKRLTEWANSYGYSYI